MIFLLQFLVVCLDGMVLNPYIWNMNIIQKISEDNLCTYFVLPLLKLSKISFIKSNFVETYLTHDGSHIVVQVYDLTLLSRGVSVHPNFKSMYIKDGFFYLVYEIPKVWDNDVKLFMKGKFSSMTLKAHTMIRTYSGLDYKKKTGNGTTVTDGILLALTRSPMLRQMWIDEFKLRETDLDENDELLSIPPDKSYIRIEDLKKYP